MANQLYLRADFASVWTGQDPFACVEKLTGKNYREVANRKTLRFELNGKSYFVKIHRGVGLIETIKSFLHGNLPVWGAEQELLAIKKLQMLGIETMTPAAFGVKGFLPWRQKSFLITDELVNTVSLEDICAKWKQEPPAYAFKKVLIEKVAIISRLLHSNGLNHRDFYICHFLLANSSFQATKRRDLLLYLIDLHRVQQRTKTPLRWMIKDIGSLYFSTFNVGLTQRDKYRFIKYYMNTSIKKALTCQTFWQQVQQRADELYRK